MNDAIDLRTTVSKAIEKNLLAGKKPNRLFKEKSPYLLQHAFNPVDWFPWTDEAFEKARNEDKPVFLSVGYSTCYWCHVMEREIFENELIAAMMNKQVVSIKVDREERPDVDHVYMTALQATTGSGGWPMSVFMTHDRKPFFAATYLPPVSQYGRVGFPELLQRIEDLWHNDRAKLLESSENIVDLLRQSAATKKSPKEITADILDRGFEIFERSYDNVHGGFGTAPKFPRPVVFNFLFRHFKRTGNGESRDMSLDTLRKMAHGGMYDQIGSGFHRYSTDERWHVPHFEKMLYDQAQLAIAYLEAYQITHEDFFKEIVHDVLSYVQHVMTDAEGAFYSAEDAESAIPSSPETKKEGAFYVWTKKEIESILDQDEALAFSYRYGVEEEGNVQSDPRGEFVNENILLIGHSIEETARHTGRTVEETHAILSNARQKIFMHRQQRIRPHLDDKILVSWNGLMISAFARAFQVLQNQDYLDSAVRASQFIVKRLFDPKSGALLRRYRDGEAKYEGNLSDYAFLTQGLLDLYEASLDFSWLSTAITLTDAQIRIFYDSKEGGFFDTSGNDRTILFRSKEEYDGAEPSGNSIAILNLLRLSQMVGNTEYYTCAVKSLEYFAEDIEKNPHALVQFLVAVDFNLSKAKQIILAGEKDDPPLRAMLREIHTRFIPRKVLLLADGGDGQRFLSSHVPFLGSVKKVDGRTTVYVCRDYACELPTSDIVTLARILEAP